MVVTINTDASWHPIHKCAGYAFWITCSNGRYKRSGKLNDTCDRAEIAEFRCIINSVHYMLNRVVSKPGFVIINTDCMNVIHVINGEIAQQRRWGLLKNKHFQELRDTFWKLIPEGVKIEVRHVKAHVSTDTPRDFVNDWCDREAKKQLHKFLNKN